MSTQHPFFIKERVVTNSFKKSIASGLLFLLTMLAGQDLYTIETEDIRIIYYDKEHEFVVNHLARCAENALTYHKELFNYNPDEKVTILLHDFNDYGGGGTSTIPWNFILLGMEPMDYVYETQPSNERMNWLMNHEMVHVVATDKGNKSDHLARKAFSGKVSPTDENPISMVYAYMTNPRRWSPRWYHEGIAVFLETWMAGGAGRVMGGYDEMMFRTMVKDSVYFYDFVGIESEGTTIDFQIGQVSYLYGTRFVNYLATQYSPGKLMSWFTRTDSSQRYFSKQFQEVYGTNLDHEWATWIQFEKEFQNKNLSLIREYPVTQSRPISKMALGSVSKSFYRAENNQILSAILYPGSMAQIAGINIQTGTIDKLSAVPTPALYYVTSLAWDGDNTLFYTTDNSRGWRDINALNISTGKTRELLKDFRTGDLTFNRSDKSLWGVQHHNGYSRIVRVPPPYNEGYIVLSLDYGTDLVDIEISPDGEFVIGALLEISGNQNLVKIEMEDLLNGYMVPEILFDFDNSSPASFTFSNDGQYIYGSSYYTGVSNIVRYDFINEEMEWITNAETGFFRPIPVSTDSLIVFEFTGEGFLPVMIANQTTEDVNAVDYLGMKIVDKYPELKDWMLGSPAAIDLDGKTTYSGKYDPKKNLKLASLIPVIEGYKNKIAFGVKFNIADPLSLHDLNITMSYTPNSEPDEQFHITAGYSYWDWKFSAAYNGADFYDLFGPTKSSRKGHSVGLDYNKVLINNPPQKMNFTAGLKMYGGLETVPDFQNESVKEGFTKYYNSSLKLNYSQLRKTLGAVESERGYKVFGALSGNYADENLFPKMLISGDLGIPMPIEHSSIWIRTSIGKSFIDDSEPLANFYFGGFGNNWVDVGSIERYREHYTFPGLALNDTSIAAYPGGPVFGKILTELALPPLRFKRIGFPSLYGRWLKVSFFGSYLSAGSGGSNQQFMNGGIQVDFKMVMFSTQDVTLSFGTAIARNIKHADEEYSPEFMVSLKIL